MKKKTIAILGIVVCVLFLFTPDTAKAVIAYPYPVEITQPDGSKLTIFLKGDEKVKWAETSDGYSIMFNNNRTYEYATLDINNNMVPSGKQANDPGKRSSSDDQFLNTTPKKLKYSQSQIGIMKNAWALLQSDQVKSFPTTGSRKLVCILIGFTDKAFTKTQTEFTNLFNQLNYTADGATGSVKDYYLETSYNQLSLTMTVAGPYTASQNMAYYGANNSSGDDIRPRELVTEAVNLANPDVNYADFDNDNNGSVDGVYVIYAGYGEEYTGASPDCIWAHSWSISPVILDGKTISSYACSSELRGNSGTGMTRIGVFCHEFGHILGSPDFYDTDYSTNGQYDGTGYWDLMASGSWNNGGKTPAHHNAYTKTVVFNWASPTTLSEGAYITLSNAAEYSNSFYRYNTTTTNEFFLIENRQQIKFDASIPGHGLIIYHVDGNYINTAGNGINAGSHQGMYPVCAVASGNPPATYGTINGGGCPFPGTGSKTAFTDATTPYSKSWAGANTARPITNITENLTDKTVSFTYMGGPCIFPGSQATSFTWSALADNSMTIGWTRGTGNSVLVVARRGSTVNANPANGTDYNANAAFGSGTEIGTGNFVVYKGTGTSVNLTALISGTTYYYAVYEYTSASYCYLAPALTGNASTTGCSYCASSGNMVTNKSITLVNFNTINNVTAKPAACNDYTTISTSVNKGSSYNLTVNVNTGGNYPVHAYAWIDWNKNCDFSDPGESFDLGFVKNTTNGNTSLSPLSISIPSTALTGRTIMRVAAKFSADPASCETAFDGEVEDYAINVTFACTSVTITTQPAVTQTTCSGSGSASFSVVAGGTLPVTYQWQYNNGSTWESVTNGIPAGATYSNTTASVFSVIGISAANTYQYRCYLTNCSGANNVTSNTASLIVNPLPAAAGAITGPVLVNPASAGNAYSLAAIANATSYIWAYSGTGATINGTGTSVTVDFAGGATSGTLTVKGHNSCGDGPVSSLSIAVAKSLNIKVFLEGPYAGAGLMNTALNPTFIPLAHPYSGAPWNVAAAPSGSIPAGVVDWVLVELRDAATPEAALSGTALAGWPKAFFLKSDGSIVGLDGASKPNIGNPTVANKLFVIVRHRNHLAIMSSDGAGLSGNIYSYDFTTALSQAYGGGAGYKQLGTGTFGMVAGDIDHDGQIFVSDYNAWAVQFGITNTYSHSDLDQDGSVFVSDYNKWAANFGITTTNPTLLKSAELKPKYVSSVPK